MHTQGPVGANQFVGAAVSSTVKRECILMSREENVFSSGRAFVSPTIRVASHQQHVAGKPQHNTKQATLLAWNKIWGGLTEYL